MNPTLSLTDLTTTCVTCGGSGWAIVPGDPEAKARPCPDCDARGWLLDPERLEAAAKVVALLRVAEHDFTLKYETDQAWAKAALLAYLEESTSGSVHWSHTFPGIPEGTLRFSGTWSAKDSSVPLDGIERLRERLGQL